MSRRKRYYEEDSDSYANVCLFCLTNLPSNWADFKVLETVTAPAADHCQNFSVRLDDPEKNESAFNFLCEALGLRWANRQGALKLDRGDCLPLCVRCQHLFQESYQLHIQMTELGKLMKQALGLIMGFVRSSEAKKPQRTPRFELYGLHQIRDKVNSQTSYAYTDPSKAAATSGSSKSKANTNETEACNENVRVTITTVPNSAPSPVLEEPIVKIEVNEDSLYHIDTFDGWEETGHENDGEISDHGSISEEKGTRRSFRLKPFKKVTPGNDEGSDYMEEIEHGSSNDSDDDEFPNSSESDDDFNYNKKGCKRTQRSKPKTSPPKIMKSSKQSAEVSLDDLLSLTCHLCEESLSDKKEFLDHYAEKHPEEQKYTCKFCKSHFTRLRDCQSHQWSHTGEKPFCCSYCLKRYSTKKARDAHQRWVHEGKGNLYPCKFTNCEKLFPTPTMLKAHEVVHNETVVICKACGKSFKSEYSFYKHNKNLHEGKAECSEPLLNPTDEVLTAMGVSVPSNNAKLCHICWKPQNSGKETMQKHFNDYHNGHPLTKCAVCEKTFSDYRETRKHAYRHLGEKKVQCDVCGKSFVTKTELKSHSISHLSESERPKFICDTCGMVFSTKNRLTEHHKIHTENRPRFFCELCGKTYSNRKGYTHHKKSSHLDETPHKCQYCDKSYVGKSELLKHLRIHTKVKPYKCPNCEKFFPYTSSRSRHIREVHKGENVRKNRGKKKPAVDNNINNQTETVVVPRRSEALPSTSFSSIPQSSSSFINDSSPIVDTVIFNYDCKNDVLNQFCSVANPKLELDN